MKALRYAGYAAFFFFSFVVGLYLFFPWTVAEERILQLASRGSYLVTSEGMRPSGPTSFRFRNVTLTHKDHPEVPLVIDELRARLHVLPLLRGGFGVSVEAWLARGQVQAVVKQSTEQLRIDAEVEDVQLDFAPLLAAVSGLPLSGRVSLSAQLALARVKGAETSGQVKLESKSLVLEKGAKLGMFPLPMNVELGDLTLELPVEDGKLTIPMTELQGSDLAAKLEGTVNIEVPLQTTNMNLTVGLQPTQKFLAANQLIGPILNNFSQYKSPDGFYRISLKGNVGRPIVSPVRGGR